MEIRIQISRNWEDPDGSSRSCDTGNPWRLPDLEQEISFLYSLGYWKNVWKVESKQPGSSAHSMAFNPPGTPVDYTFDLDLEDYEEVASLLRSLNLLLLLLALLLLHVIL